MFLSCCVYEQEYSTDFLFYSLRQIYLTIPDLKYIGYLVSKDREIDKSLYGNVPPRSYNGSNYFNNKEKSHEPGSGDQKENSAIKAMSATKQRFFFNQCNSIEKDDPLQEILYSYSLWMCYRKDLVYILKIRKARVEDCDDLVPMFKNKNLLNDPDSIYYFSELLEAKDENLNTIVGEINSKIVGFMTMRSNIEYSELLDNFELDTYESIFNDMYEVDIDEDILRNFSSNDISNKSKKDSKSKSSQDGKISSDVNRSTSIMDNNKIMEQVENKLQSLVNIKDDGNEVVENIRDSTILSSDTGKEDFSDEMSKQEDNKTNSENMYIPSDSSDSIETITDLKKIVYIKNAICINLFYIDDCYTSYSNEFLKAAFNLYPDKEYCLISLPTQELHIPLLESMTAVDYREDANIRHSLYICHRDSTLNIINVRKGDKKDIEKIDQLIKDTPEYTTIMHKLKLSLLSSEDENNINENNESETNENENKENEKMSVYVAECLDMIVGFAILQSYDDPNVLIEQFNIEKYCTKENHQFSKDDEFILSYIIMSPIYENKSRYFLEEIMRQTDVNCLIHTFNEPLDFSTHKIISKEFVPVKRRKLIQFVDNKRDINEVADHLNYNISLITTNLLYEPRITINTRIVVIGASDTGTSFLETLIYKTHYLFNNLILVSSNDSYGSKDCPYAVDNMNYSVHDLEKINIENYVQFINNVVKTINREDKTIVLDSKEIIEYDYLIITTGLQFHPEVLDKKFSELQGIYSGSNIETCIEFIESLANTSTEQNYVVYGNDIQAFPILKALTENVQPEQIFFVVPNYDKNIRQWFDNRPLEKKILNFIDSLGVRILLNYQLVSFESQGNKLTDIILNSTIDENQKSVIIDKIDGFFYVDKKTTNIDIFNAINNSYLVFDGNLIIGSHFQTNDDYIFSAGPLTRYTSRYETLWNHSYYNSKECGKKLALTLLPIFEGNEKAINDIKKENEALISFNDLVATRSLLPGDLMYFHFDRPYLYNQTKAFRKTDKNYGRDLIIHNNNEVRKKNADIEYFHIHIDIFGFIQSVTYIGNENLFSENMLCLYGMHEKYLNRLISRFDEGIIPDFKKFFNEPWAQPLFHDRFRSYMKRLRADLMNPTPSSVPLLPLESSSSSVDKDDKDDKSGEEEEKPMDMSEILDKLYDYASRNEIVPDSERVKLYNSFDRSFDRKKVDNTVYRFLVESGFYNFP
jgi:thioredoxin reductase